MKPTILFLTLITTFFACGKASEEITKNDLIGSWQEVHQDPLDTFLVGEVLNFFEDGSFTQENSYLQFNDNISGKWTYDETAKIVTYSFGGIPINDIQTVKFVTELELLTLDNNLLTVNYHLKEGFAKFIRPLRVYEKRE